ncbi:hypothetical protein ACO2Q1_04095 [Brevundimonas sp. VNH65]|uniref:hypothetical protein n=1 Tax=Brevundimonas sp. VNH65 TaxID=3400917 RepID=UPI003C00B1B8
MTVETSLAEGRWLWRRLYVFAASLGLWALLARTVEIVPPAALLPLARGLMGLMALLLTIYLVAPTAQQLVALTANLRLRLEAGRVAETKGGRS